MHVNFPSSWSQRTRCHMVVLGEIQLCEPSGSIYNPFCADVSTAIVSIAAAAYYSLVDFKSSLCYNRIMQFLFKFQHLFTRTGCKWYIQLIEIWTVFSQ